MVSSLGSRATTVAAANLQHTFFVNILYIKKHVKNTFLRIYCILNRREPEDMKKSFKPIVCKQIKNY